jgi:hypothetical protein
MNSRTIVPSTHRTHPLLLPPNMRNLFVALSHLACTLPHDGTQCGVTLTRATKKHMAGLRHFVPVRARLSTSSALFRQQSLR